MALSATYSVTDVKAQLEGYAFYDYVNEAALTSAVNTALDEAMYDYLLPTIGWAAYGEIRDLDRTLFDDSTCDTVIDDATVTMDDTTNLVEDMYVNGVGVPVGSTVDSITNSTTFELTNQASANGTNVTLTFNRLSDEQYAIYRAEVNYACYSFVMFHSRQKYYTREGTNGSRSQGGVQYSYSVINGPEQMAAKFLKRANTMLAAGGYSFTGSIKRGNSFHL